jgi:mannose-6-phosphate isomerase
MAEPYVLTFGPILKEKVWGGRRLAGLGKALAPGVMVGESWEVADLGSTSVGGGGGGEARSVISNGALAGRTLHEAMGLWAPSLLAGGGFPLLVKFLDAREHLSVQVHPSPAFARAHADAHLKTECWYVLEAEPGGLIFKGVKPGVTRGRFEAALRAGQGEGVVALLDSAPAVVGECHNLPSGTVHALGAGVLVAEVQTPSDTTFRVYDWAAEYGRVGRGLHVEEALACIDFGPAERAVRAPAGPGVTRLVTTEFYTVDEVVGMERVGIAGDSCLVVVGVGGVTVIGQEGRAETVLARGGVALVPPGVRGRVGVDSGARGLVFRLGTGPAGVPRRGG